MRPRTTLILLAVALVLAGYFWLVEQPRRARENATADRSLTALRPELIDSVTIARPGHTLRFSVVGTHWEMNEPVADLADQTAVTRLLAAIAQAHVERNLGPQDDLGPYGMSDPVVVTAVSPDAKFTVRIGGYTVDRSFVYGSLDASEDVLMLPTAIRRYASAAVEDFRFKRVATFDVATVDSFVVESPAVTMSWARFEDRWLTVVSADTIFGNPTAVEGILRRLRGLRVIAFPAADRDHLAVADYHITVHASPPAPPRSFAMTPAPASVVVVTRPDGRVVEVDTTAMQIYAFGLNDLREKRLLRFDRERIARVELVTADTLATLVRVAGAWTYPNPGMGDLAQGRVNAALGAAAALEFHHVISEHRVAGDLGGEPTFRLAVFDDGGTLIDELLCRDAPGGDVARATSRSSRLLAGIAISRLKSLEDRFRRIHQP